MICERCQQKSASVHLQQIINGKKTERHFCKECAAQFEMPISLEQFFQGFLGSFESSPHTAEVTCPECGFSYKRFKDSGRLGCKVCYPTFRDELVLLLKHLHGSSEHQGKFPKKAGAELLSKRRIETLRHQLNKAVESEEYEEAARLRDEIRQLEVGESK